MELPSKRDEDKSEELMYMYYKELLRIKGKGREKCKESDREEREG